MKKGVFCILILTIQFCFSQGHKRIGELSEEEFCLSKKEMYVVDDFFEYRKNLDEFLGLKPGDTIAEMGAGNGECSGILSVLFDNLNFYLEEIDKKTLNGEQLEKIKKKYGALRKSPQTNTFHYVIGDTVSSNLPDSSFDKIIMFQAFHEFTQVDAMLNDLSRKLKPDGKLIIMDAFSLKDKTIHCSFGHRGLQITEATDIIARHGFFLSKMRSPENNIVHYANALCFERKSMATDLFKTNRESVSELSSLILSLNNSKKLHDTLRFNAAADSLVAKAVAIKGVYIGFECWVKDIALQFAEKKDIVSAIRLLKLNERLFPDSFENCYWLGKAYAKAGKKNMSRFYREKANALSPDSGCGTYRIKKS